MDDALQPGAPDAAPEVGYAVDTRRSAPWHHGAAAGMRTLVRQRRLIRELVHRDVADRYRGSALGILWSFVHPLLLLATYTFVFSFIFRASWPGTDGRPLVFALMVFCGLMPFTMISEVATKCCDSILSASSYVKRVTFPLDVLPVVPVGAAIVHLVTSLGVLAIGEFLVLHRVPWTFVLVPFILLPYILVLLAIAYLLACLGVYFRDLGHIITVGLTLLMFLSPILYPGSMVPEWAGLLLAYNPLAYVAEELRAVAVWGDLPAWAPWLRHTGMGILLYAAALILFHGARKQFADVL